MLSIHRIINSPIPSNCFVIYDKTTGADCVIVDPGCKNNEELIGFVSQTGLKLVYIILTHEHFDHCLGVNELVKEYQVPIICSELCAECVRHEKRNCSVFYENNAQFTINTKTISVESLGFEMPFARTTIKFYYTPGHTDASISFVIDKFLFTGDTLLKDIKTVTKLPTGSLAKLKESLQIYSQLQGHNLLVLPGHGDSFQLNGYELDKAFLGSENIMKNG